MLGPRTICQKATTCYLARTANYAHGLPIKPEIRPHFSIENFLPLIVRPDRNYTDLPPGSSWIRACCSSNRLRHVRRFRCWTGRFPSESRTVVSQLLQTFDASTWKSHETRFAWLSIKLLAVSNERRKSFGLRRLTIFFFPFFFFSFFGERWQNFYSEKELRARLKPQICHSRRSIENENLRQCIRAIGHGGAIKVQSHDVLNSLSREKLSPSFAEGNPISLKGE